MTILKQPRAEATRRSILRAAEDIFADVGFTTAKLEDVARVVGIRRPSIVYHFPGKQELYDAVESTIFETMHALVQVRLDGVSGALPRLIALLDTWLDYMVERPSAARIIMRLVADVTPRHGDPVRYSRLVLADLDAIVAEGIEAGVFRPLAGATVLNGVGASVLFYVCNGNQVGVERTYDAADPATLAAFRALLHRIAHAAILIDDDATGR